MTRYKNAVIVKTIFDGVSRTLRYRNIGHAATVMNGRVHAVNNLIELTESFKSEVDFFSHTITTTSERIL